ncbi:MAG: radical SAM protein, partial [Candidatus Edwardsbacteria bacterium]|nr:radical SAM protein [Candidatus Edwardsbacteria bacterium]
HRCSYCIVPLARGPSRSRKLAELIAEAGRLAAAGHKELVVTGVRLGEYRPSLRILLKSLETVPGVERLRLSSLEPDDLDQDTVDAVAQSRKTARHLHLPLQSGDDRILGSMRRPYTLRRFSDLLAAVRRAVPEMTFGTDIIAGFPGETEEQFNRSFQAVRDLPITHLHAFTYSRRPGTAAAAMAGQIPGPVARERSQRLREMFEKKQRAYWETLAGSTTAVLFESAAKGLWTGLGEHYFRVSVPSRQDLGNTLRPVRLTGAAGGGMSGELAGQR